MSSCSYRDLSILNISCRSVNYPCSQSYTTLEMITSKIEYIFKLRFNHSKKISSEMKKQLITSLKVNFQHKTSSKNLSTYFTYTPLFLRYVIYVTGWCKVSPKNKCLIVNFMCQPALVRVPRYLVKFSLDVSVR